MTDRTMRTTGITVIAVAAILATATETRGQQPTADADPRVRAGRVHGTVVQVTAQAVFVDFGASHGVRVGDRVTVDVGRQALEVPVLDVWQSGARCRLDSDQPIPRVGASANAATQPVPKRRRRTGRRLSKPRPLEQLLASWQGVSRERPALIIHGRDREGGAATDERDERASGALALEYVLLLDASGDRPDRQFHQLALRSDLDIPSLWGGRLDYQHRVRLRSDVASDLISRPFFDSRSLLRIYRLRARLHLGAFTSDVGRTPAGVPGAALPGAGLIDGINVRSAVARGVHVGAWAGAMPRLTDLRPAGGALGFGVYSSLRRQLKNRKRTRITADGGFLATVFDGQLDRRALSLRASISEPDRWLHGQFVADIGAETRPAVEPSLVFLDAGARLPGGVRATVRFDHVRSVRTAEALSELPPGYLSTVAFTAVRAGADLRLTGGLYASARAGWRLSAEGASSMTSSASLRAHGLWLADDHISLGLDGALGSYIDGAAARINYTLPVHRRVDLGAGYRIYGYRYGGENQRLFRHQPSLSLDGRLSGGFHGHVDVDAFLGAEETVLATFASLAMRF